MKEIWKDVIGYEGLYQVSNLGKIKRVMFTNGKYSFKKERLLNKFLINGYEKVELNKNGIGKPKFIHRLVAEAFIPNPENKLQVNHIDGNKQNNCISNLEWATPSENTKHAYMTGLAKSPNINKYGNLNHSSKEVIQYDLKNIKIKTYGSTKEVMRVTGYDSSCIARCCRGKLKTAYGYVWRYANE